MFQSLMEWLTHHGKDALETVAVIASLFFSTASFRSDARERKISTLISLTSGHRELWTQIDDRPDLERIMMEHVDLAKFPVTKSEKRFVHLLITHFAMSYAAARLGMIPGMAGLEKDAKAFFSLPIPNQVWKWSREFQNADLVTFVDDCLGGRPKRKGWLSTLRSPRF